MQDKKCLVNIPQSNQQKIHLIYSPYTLPFKSLALARIIVIMYLFFVTFFTFLVFTKAELIWSKYIKTVILYNFISDIYIFIYLFLLWKAESITLVFSVT